MKANRLWFGFAAGLWLTLSAVTGCAHPFTGLPGPISTPSPVPTGSPGPSPSPGACATQDPNASIIFMSANAAPTVDPKFGPIFGYTNGIDSSQQPLPTTIITVATGVHLQFVNYDFNQTHSAASIAGISFPPPSPNPFPSGAAQPIGAAISSSPWSTGLIQAVTSFYCFSQSFTTPAVGTYLFGDLQTYGITNTRDIIIVHP